MLQVFDLCFYHLCLTKYWTFWSFFLWKPLKPNTAGWAGTYEHSFLCLVTDSHFDLHPDFVRFSFDHFIIVCLGSLYCLTVDLHSGVMTLTVSNMVSLNPTLPAEEKHIHNITLLKSCITKQMALSRKVKFILTWPEHCHPTCPHGWSMSKAFIEQLWYDDIKLY